MSQGGKITSLDKLGRLMSPRHYGFIEFFIGKTSDDASSFSLDVPESVIRKRDLDELGELHLGLVRGISKEEYNPTDSQREESVIVSCGNIVISKVICLIYALLISYHYYHHKADKYPDYKPSVLLDQNVCDDLSFWFRNVYEKLLTPSPAYYEVQSRALQQLYCVMRLLFDVLGNWLPCDEVMQLRNLYDEFQNFPGDGGKALKLLLQQFTKLANRFAAEETKWEVERTGAASQTTTTPKTATTPKSTAEEGDEYFKQHGRHKPGPRGAHKTVSIAYAAKVWKVNKSTIGNWDLFLESGGKSGKKPPAGYYGRDMSKEAFENNANKGNASDYC